MAEFKIQSEFTPQGDQPAAIDALVDGLNRGEQYQTLLGVTGSGKTFSIANVIQVSCLQLILPVSLRIGQHNTRTTPQLKTARTA